MAKKRYAPREVPALRFTPEQLEPIQDMGLAEALDYLYPICGHLHAAGKRERISDTRAVKRRTEALHIFATIAERYPEVTVRGCKDKHVRYAVRVYLERVIRGFAGDKDGQRLAIGSWNNMKSSLDFWLTMFGKPGLLMPMRMYVTQDLWNTLTRRRASLEDKSMLAAGIDDVEEWIQEAIVPVDERLSHCFRLGNQFGLRQQETCWVDIHHDVQHLKGGTFLRVRKEGAKNGRPRKVLVRTAEQFALLAELRAFYAGHVGVRVGARSRNEAPKDTLQRLRALCRKVGLCRSELGATFHSLRHGYVHRLFQAETGIAVAVKGGDPKLADELGLFEPATKTISTMTGHSRDDICTAYGVIRPRSPFLQYVLEKARGGDFGPTAHPQARKIYELLHGPKAFLDPSVAIPFLAYGVGP